MNATLAFLAVGSGGALGSILRYAVTLWSVERLGPGFPWHTAAINIAGSFAIALLAALSQSSIGLSPSLRTFAMAGVLGGFTTFSTFSFDIVTLVTDGAANLALAYCVGTVVLGVLAAFAGLAVGRLVLHPT